MLVRKLRVVWPFVHADGIGRRQARLVAAFCVPRPSNNQGAEQYLPGKLVFWSCDKAREKIARSVTNRGSTLALRMRRELKTGSAAPCPVFDSDETVSPGKSVLSIPSCARS